MKKIKNFLIYIVVIFILLNLYGIYKRYSSGYSVLSEADLRHKGDSQEFEFSTKNGKYIIGLSVKNADLDAANFDGNYTIAYYLNGKYDRTEVINRVSLSELYKNKGLYHIGSSWSGGVFFKPVVWDSITLGQVTLSGKHKIKITVHKPASKLKMIKSQLYFFADYLDERTSQMFKNFNSPERKVARRKERLLKNYIDANETNKTLIPLRQAIDTHDLEKVKEIIKADNNITVNTNMVFQRRALHYAAFQNDIKIAKYLIDNGADIHHKDELGKNALAYSIENNATKMAKLLIDSGINVNEVVFVQNYLSNKIEQRYKGRVMSALQYTAGNSFFEMTELLLNHGMQDNIIKTEGTNINVYTYIYLYTTMNKKEKEQMQQLFDKYGVKVEDLNQHKSLFKK